MSKQSELDRRNFLKRLMVGTGAIATCPFEIYLTNMVLHYLQKGYALAAGDEQSFSETNLIHFSMEGGVARWYWDLPLTPNGNDTLGTDNKMLITKYLTNNGLITGGEYSTFKIGDYYMPHVWSGLMATSDGGSAPMSELAKNMLIMRGINLQIDSHAINRYKQVAPISGKSLLGSVADNAKTPIPAMSYNSQSNYYYSEKGVPNVLVSQLSQLFEPLKTVLSPFTSTGNLTSVHNNTISSAIDRALAFLSQSSNDKHKFLPTTYQQRLDAKKMLNRGFTGFAATFTQLCTKYQTLINRSYGDSSLHLEGVEDIAINGGGDSKLESFESWVDDNPLLFRFDGDDLRTLTDIKSSIAYLPQGMAVAEYMIMNGLSSAINIQTLGHQSVIVDPANLKLINAERRDTGGLFSTKNNLNRGSVRIDQHEMGAYVSLMLNTRYARAYSSCLYELINKLKSVSVSSGGTLFDRTAIAVTTDFNRSARADGSGSDHGWSGSSYTVYSGQIENLTIVGNISNRNTPSSPIHNGMWGDAAGVDEFGGRIPLIGNAASTLATILNLKSPTPNDQSFLYRDGNKLKTVVGKPTNKA